MMSKVLVVGHSFINRLQRALGQIAGCNYNLELDPNSCVIEFYGISGGTLDRLADDHRFVDKLREFRPDIIVLQLGGNDLCNPTVRPEVFACRLVEWSESLLKQFSFLGKVIVCELFIREKPRHTSAETYEYKRTFVNHMLKDMLEVIPNLSFWRHLRLMNSPLAILSEDGVHQ
jgi:lysophospholipase L1-like esterase